VSRPQEFRVLVATDGSRDARAAVAATLACPWPAGTRVQGMVARGRAVHAPDWPPAVWAVLDQGLERVAADARRALGRRWPDAEVVIVDRSPVEAILSQARRLGAGAIVLGWRGHGVFRRLLMGSVSRGVVRRAPCPVLVVRRRPAAIRRVVIGLDGSAQARRAVTFVARLPPPRDGHVTLVQVVEPMREPATPFLPASLRATISREVAALTAERRARARREVARAATELKRAGWAVTSSIRVGAPLADLLEAVEAVRADLLVVGARGVGGVERLLLGSVAEGALNQCPVPVLVVR
jgi:nucleotide-binding universal stress UspA family protein